MGGLGYGASQFFAPFRPATELAWFVSRELSGRAFNVGAAVRLCHEINIMIHKYYEVLLRRDRNVFAMNKIVGEKSERTKK